MFSCVRTRQLLSRSRLYKESLFQKYKLQLTAGIHIFSVFIVIIPTRLLCQMYVNSSGAEFLSTISKFIKRMNYVIACLRPSQNEKSGIFLGSRAVDGKEVYKKSVIHVQSCCSALSSYCLFDFLVAAAS